MLFVKVPKEIKEYEEKMFLGLSSRQMIWGVLAIVCSIATYFTSRIILGDDLASWLTLLVGVPLFACGFLSYQGMPMNKFIKTALRYYTEKQILTYDNEYPKEDKKHEKELTKKARKIARKERKQLSENQEN